jgi:mRNA interferase MazF
MTGYEFGDVVLIPFPFTDQTTTKKRPAVVVSSAVYHLNHPDIILMAITSQIKSSIAFGEVTLAQWEAAGLLKPSVIKPVFTTVEKNFVIKNLGQLSEEDQQALKKALQTILG